MKKLTALVLALITVFLTICLTACSGSSTISGQPSDGKEIDNNTPDDNGTPAKSKTQPTLEKLTNTGEIPYNIFRCNLYDNKQYGDYAKYFDNELFPYLYNNQYGYADASGKVVIKEQFKNAGFFSENKAFAEKDGKWHVIDTSGNILYTLPDTDHVDKWYDKALFQNGKAILIDQQETKEGSDRAYIYYMYVLTSDFKLSIIENIATLYYSPNASTKVISTPEFTGLLIEYPKREVDTNTGLYTSVTMLALYDINGSVIWNLQSDHSYFEEIQARDKYVNLPNENGQWGLFDLTTKQFVINCSYEYIGLPSDDMVSICRYKKWGYADLTGTIKIEPAYIYAADFRNGTGLVLTDDCKLKAVDKSGNITADYNVSIGKQNNFYIPSSTSAVTVITDKGHFYVVDNFGNTLYSAGDETKLHYVSDKYIFYDDKMLKIE